MNNRHDNILGYCFCEKCKGVEKQNILGKILMEVRNELMNKIEISFLDLNDAFRFKDSIDVELNIFKCTHKTLPNLKKYFVTNTTEPIDECWNFEIIK